MTEPEHHHEHHHTVSYADAVAEFRADKDAFFKNANGSPVPVSERDAFRGLPYFAIDERLRLDPLPLLPYTGNAPVQFEIPTSDGRLRTAERAGVFRFTLDAVDCSLTGYRFANSASGTLFVPFLDATSGTETYGAGRYLDVEAEEDGTYSLDFNLAYHPSCVYDPRFSCPITPAENRLSVRVEAGERLAAGHE